MSIKALQEYTRFSKYAKYNPEAGRREFWDEQVERVFKMHREKLGDSLYEQIKDDMEFAQRMVEKKRVLGSQRALQFGGSPILKKNPRMFNCVVSYCDRPRFFQECIYLLLCGCGCGFSVQKHHVDKLPKLALPSSEKKVYQIPDSIEGWSDALGILMCSYFDSDLTEFQDYRGVQVEFDYSLIRPEGAPLSSGGKAPGPDGLMRALEKIRYLLNKTTIHNGKLRPIDAYDVCMHASDAVLSGGIRRSASISIFSPDDEEMIKAKTGSWFIENPQRGRSNNSVLLVRNETSKEQFSQLMHSVKEFGEPGFIWTENKETLYNPCVTRNGWVHTSEGPRRVYSLVGKKFNAVVDGAIYPSTDRGFFKTGDNKDIYKLETEEGFSFRSTSNHKFMVECVDGRTEWKELSEIKIGDNLYLHKHGNFKWDGNGDSIDGFEIGTSLTKSPYAYTPELVEVVEQSSYYCYAGFIDGYFSAMAKNVNGEIEVSGRLNNLETIQRMLLRLNIYSILDASGVLKIDFVNSLKVNELISCEKFIDNSTKEIEETGMWNCTVKSIEKDGVEDVYDCTIPEIHAFDLNGFYAHNCVEIGFCAYLDLTDKKNEKIINSSKEYQDSIELEKKRQSNDSILSGWAFCNLCEINMKKCKTEEEFLESCKAASIIGSVQASYSHFPYLGGVTDMIVKREALLGVSMTGMADSPDIAFNPEIQRKGAKVVLDTNERISKIIGTNVCARGTCVKPAGSTSCVLGSASGIHPHHAKRYLRRVQANKLEVPLQHFQKYNPLAIENSVWSANNTDVVVTFLCEVPDGVKTKNQVNAITLLENVKLTQQNWVEYGTRVEECIRPWLRHNVSNTCTVKPEEWGDVEDFIYDNKAWFAGISLLPASGDKDYPQAPFTAVYTPTETVRKYGDGSLFGSGLIVDGHHAFDNDLWAACDCALGVGEVLDTKSLRAKIEVAFKTNGQYWKDEGLSPESPERLLNAWLKHNVKNYSKKLDWVRRAKQFATRYFNDDLREMTYCLKDIYNWKVWCDLSREYVEVDWSQCFETEQGAMDTEAGSACAGGKCELGDLGIMIEQRQQSQEKQ